MFEVRQIISVLSKMRLERKKFGNHWFIRFLENQNVFIRCILLTCSKWRMKVKRKSDAEYLQGSGSAVIRVAAALFSRTFASSWSGARKTDRMKSDL